jgi:predicted nucleic acid-binding protein
VILLDANYFLRYLVQPSTPELRVMAETANALFAAVERGDVEVTTTEVVLHEVAYVLASKAHYALPAADIVTGLATILRLPGMRFPRGEKKRYLRALELWASFPALGLADALVAATALERGVQLATFDRDFDRIPELERWDPAGAAWRARDHTDDQNGD